MDKVYNFSSGPAVLPQQVFDASAEAVKNFQNSGLSILEMSHRSKEIVAVAEEAVKLVKELLQVPEGYQVLFLQGGASLQFLMAPYNLLPEGGEASYTETGVWAKKAIKEAKLLGKVNVVASSAAENFNHIPKTFQLDKNQAYLHLTSNNTIYGTQYHQFPQVDIPLICDMSSDIFSRPLDISKFDCIYAGAQKNLSCAGTTLVIVKESALGKTGRKIPSMLDYQIHIKEESMFNTPPVFSIYVALETLKWIKQMGGLTVMEKKNQAKAAKLYQAIDQSKIFKGTAAKEDRSLMNVTFVLENSNWEAEFLDLAKKRKLSGIKGHRSVGGFRASIYNAMPEEGIDALISAMQEFEKAKTGSIA